jgi:4-diphosphocytidyl-2-C-methyl-D-erythritol kinase
MFLRAPCKINLTLDVFDKKERTDGYHNLDSLVVPFGDLADELRIHIEPTADGISIRLTCNDPHLPTDNRNLAYRAAHAYLTHINRSVCIEIDLYKRVPAEAGLGGGSSNAATVLRALNTYFNQIVDRSTLTMIAARLGADVPLFLAEKPVRMRGCGEIIEPLDFELPVFWGVLVHPGTGVSTAHAYALLDAMPNRQPGASTEQLLSRLCEKKEISMNISDLLATSVSNDFESVVLAAYSNVAKAYEMIVTAGALRALLCGSGSAVFGLARDSQHARQLLDTLTVHFSFVTLVSSASDDVFHIKQLS